MNRYLQQLLDLFRPRTVDAALGAFNRSLAHLKRIEEAHRDTAAEQLKLEQEAQQRRAVALDEATRAHAVAERLGALVNIN